MASIDGLLVPLRCLPAPERAAALATWWEDGGGGEVIDQVGWGEPAEEGWVEVMELVAEGATEGTGAELARDWLGYRMQRFTVQLAEGQVTPLEWRMLAVQVRLELLGPRPHNGLMAAAWLEQGPLAGTIPEITSSSAYQRFVAAAPLHHGWHVEDGAPVVDLALESSAHEHRLASVAAVRDGAGELMSAHASVVGGAAEFALCADDLDGLARALDTAADNLTGSSFPSAHADPDDAFGALLARSRSERVAALTSRFAESVQRSFAVGNSEEMGAIFETASDHLLLGQAIFRRTLAGTYLTNDPWLDCLNALLGEAAAVRWDRESFGANPLGADGIVFEISAADRGFLYLFDAQGRCGQTPM